MENLNKSKEVQKEQVAPACGNTLLAVVPGKPHNGVWGDENVYKAFKDLFNEVNTLIPDHAVGLHIQGNASMCRAKAKMIVAKSKILEDMVKAVCRGR